MCNVTTAVTNADAQPLLQLQGAATDALCRQLSAGLLQEFGGHDRLIQTETLYRTPYSRMIVSDELPETVIPLLSEKLLVRSPPLTVVSCTFHLSAGNIGGMRRSLSDGTDGWSPAASAGR